MKIPEILLKKDLVELHKDRRVLSKVNVGETIPKVIEIPKGAYRMVSIMNAPILMPAHHATTKNNVIKYLKDQEFEIFDECASRTGWVGFTEEIKTPFEFKEGVIEPETNDWRININDLENNSKNEYIGTWIHSLGNYGDSHKILKSKDGKTLLIMTTLMRNISVNEYMNDSMEA